MSDLLERAAEAAYVSCLPKDAPRPVLWVDLDTRMQTHYRTIARAVLDAAEPGLFDIPEERT